MHASDAQQHIRDVERLVDIVHALRAEVDRLKKIGDTMFVEGYDQAVVEIRDHFKKAKQTEIAAEIEQIWIKGKVS